MGDLVERRAIAVYGIVQGVGFRPFVYGLASRLLLSGFVENRVGAVLIEVEGAALALDQFLSELTTHAPPLARIDQVDWHVLPATGGEHFLIQPSSTDSTGPIFIAPDVATCADCLAEIFDCNNRRHGYPFLNCTNCGPRLTIITDAPYDRRNTTLAGFPMCPACRAEYEDPANRRFHAQPTCCPACGPRLWVADAAGRPIAATDAIRHFAASLAAGRIGALKGLGGFHLACEARNDVAVRELRSRKHRDEKPFAVMVATIEAAAELCEVADAERELLASSRRPIVLLRKRAERVVALAVAPGNPCLGVVLPYTPLHHLLLRAVDGLPLVMTSGNRSDEPIAYDDDEAVRKLAGIADTFLFHDRPIHVRCDDSVTRLVDGVEMPIRRSRGYAPQPITLPFACPRPLLAVGGQLKATFALGRERHAFLSHHLGDLDHYEAFRSFEKDIALYQQLFAIRPETIVHDAHPDYATTRFARQCAGAAGLPALAVQHHHAHMASCMAENGLLESVIGVTFDGTGYGSDGTIWGGEFLVGDYRQFRRAAHLRCVGMPGGDRAIHEPWRMALAHLRDARATAPSLIERLSAVEVRTITAMLEKGLNSPLTSSAGRLFDAVATLAGVRDRVSHEGQAAMELEWLTSGCAEAGSYPFEVCRTNHRETPDAPLVVDTRPLIRAVASDVTKGVTAIEIARRFHTTLVDLIADVCERLRQATGLASVALSGGVFLNALLAREVSARLKSDGFRVYRHHAVPPNDGGLCLGQLAVAAAHFA